MAVILSMTYQKKLGLPNFSSHSCSVSLTVEIPDVSVAAQESTKLYELLQASVDAQIQEVGFMPDATTYGMDNRPRYNGNGNGHHHQNGSTGSPAPAHRRPQHQQQNGHQEQWGCTEGQRSFIHRLVNESNLSHEEVDGMAQQLFGCGARQCDRMQASQLIEEILEKVGRRTNRNGRWQRNQPARS